MYVVVIVGSEELYRFPIPESALAEFDNCTWEENVHSREKIVAMYVDYVKSMTDRLVHKFDGVSYQLVIESRLHEIINEEYPY